MPHGTVDAAPDSVAAGSEVIPDMLDLIVVGAGPASGPAATVPRHWAIAQCVSSGEFGGMAANGPQPRSKRLGLL